MPRRIYIVAGEESGDRLGGALVAAIEDLSPGRQIFAGLGGSAMRDAGVEPPFPLSEVAVMGALAILRRLPAIYHRALQVVEDAVAFEPDLVVIIDSPEFTHPIARRLRKRLSGVPIIDYVSPSVWAWRPGRARKMLGYVDEVLALLPFEPAVYRELGGPKCSYVGHPLAEAVSRLRPREVAAADPTILLLPGSRNSEVARLLPIFEDAAATIHERRPEMRFVIAAADSQVDRIRNETSRWRIGPGILSGRDAREAAMRRACLAIAASGTVTLELALARVPMVVCYRIDWLVARFRHLLRAHSVVLPNLIAGGNDIPELIHTDCVTENIAEIAFRLLEDGPERTAQEKAFDRVDAAMQFEGAPPSARAARRVLDWF